MDESKLIGEGTYGCVIQPPMKCRKSKLSQKSRSRAIGKILKLRNAKVEIKMSTYLKGIPGWERYYIVEDKDECNAKNFQEYKKMYRDQCEKIHRVPDDKLVQLIAPYGGKMLFETSITPKFNFLESLKHMLEAVEKLEKQGICHYDLHDGNIVVDYHGTLRIIDFGSAFIGDQTTEETVINHTYTFSPDYPPLSPEVTIQQGLVQGVSLPLAIQQTVEQKKIFRRGEAILGLSRWNQQRDIERFFTEEDVENAIEMYKKYWRKWDSWAVGVLFTKILEKSFLLPSFVQGVWANHGTAIRNVLRGLIQADPRKRFTAKEALDLFNKTI
jgi:serine/threonine protein kinase